METSDESRPPGLWSISGNVIGSQEHNVHLTGCYGVVLSGNTIYSCVERNLWLEDCSQITVGSNLFRRHTPKYGCGVLLTSSQNVVINGCTFEDEAEGGQVSGYPLLEISNSQRITVTGNQLINSIKEGVKLSDASQINLTGNTIIDTRPERLMTQAIGQYGKCEQIQVAGLLFD